MTDSPSQSLSLRLQFSLSLAQTQKFKLTKKLLCFQKVALTTPPLHQLCLFEAEVWNQLSHACKVKKLFQVSIFPLSSISHSYLLWGREREKKSLFPVSPPSFYACTFLLLSHSFTHSIFLCRKPAILKPYNQKIAYNSEHVGGQEDCVCMCKCLLSVCVYTYANIVYVHVSLCYVHVYACPPNKPNVC